MVLSFQDVQGEQELALRKALSVRLTQFQALAAEALAEVHLATGAVEPAPRAQGVGAQSPVRRDSVADAPPAAAQMMEKTAQDDERTMERPAQMIVEVAKFGPSCLPPQEARYKVSQERMDRAYIAGIHAGRALRTGEPFPLCHAPQRTADLPKDTVWAVIRGFRVNGVGVGLFSAKADVHHRGAVHPGYDFRKTGPDGAPHPPPICFGWPCVSEARNFLLGAGIPLDCVPDYRKRNDNDNDS